ncbi:hypothetical protein RZN25_05755 [Bacillaceae bacterium S4-13-56]
MEMTDYKWDRVIIDADFAIKMNKVTDVNAIQDYIPLFVGMLYIHEHVYENEILVPKRTRDQVDVLIEQGRAEIISVLSFEGDPFGKMVYEETINLLKSADPKTVEEGKNWGETVSIAFAKAKGINYFLSDERNLQELLDEYINNQTSQDINTIRIRNFITAMKEAGHKRKEAYKLWMASHKKDQVDWAKKMFEDQIWPI